MNGRHWAGAARKAIGLAALGSGALMLAACAGTAERSTGAEASAGRQCVFVRNINSFRAVDRSTVLFRAGVNDIWRAELFAPCNDIQFTQVLGLRSRGGGSSICGPLDAELLVRGPTGQQRCPLNSLRRLTAEEVAALAPRDRP